MTESDGYGLWSLVIINSAVFIFFAFSFAKPRTRADWRGLGVYDSAPFRHAGVCSNGRWRYR